MSEQKVDPPHAQTTNGDVMKPESNGDMCVKDHADEEQDEEDSDDAGDQDEVAANNSGENHAAAPTLSKNAQKRLLKQAKIQELRAAKKQAKKEMKAAARKDAPESGERAAKKPRMEGESVEGDIRSGRNRKERDEFDARRLAGYRVVIDLSFDDSMSEKEAKSLVVQIAHSYGTNRRSTKPLNLHLTSVGKRVGDGLKKISGYENWRCVCDERHYADMFPKTDIVYLTAESDNILQELDQSKVYCIGGIVDHNRMKGLTHRTATELGIATARLPIEGNADLGESRRVLAVNHVLAALVFYAESGSWKDAFLKALPQRKLQGQAAAAAGNGAGGEGGGGGEEEGGDEGRV